MSTHQAAKAAVKAGKVGSIRARQSEKGVLNRPLDVVYIGIAVTRDEGRSEYVVGMTVHDGTYSIDYKCYRCPQPQDNDVSECDMLSTDSVNDLALAEFIVTAVRKYRRPHDYKISGGAITTAAKNLCPSLPAMLWKQLDIVCFVFEPFSSETEHEANKAAAMIVDEESDSMARKTIEKFGPSNLPRIMVKHGNKVGVDSDGQSHMATLEDYEMTVHPNTWKLTMGFAETLKKKNIKIAFFNATPQGGGVALMRHALIRFLRLVGVTCEWYVPRPNSTVFRVTKTNHNILQGVADETAKLEPKDILDLDEWVNANAKRSWLRKGGPLAPRGEQGGADIIIVDDPQMPRLVQVAKQQDPTRPVIYRSHIQVRADLVDTPGTASHGVWTWIWERIKECDVFISHPVKNFVPKIVPKEKVGYMPATTDWLDGLNKKLSDWDTEYYMHEFCVDIARSNPNGPFTFDHPGPDNHKRPYIVQIARFDPAKGIADVLASYACLRRTHMKDTPEKETPQLVIAGHGAIDDPDAKPEYDKAIALIEEKYAELKGDIIVMRVGPTDQILNVLMQNARVALQLSTREGFEVKVSEALHAGIPVIATRRGGIPLQVIDSWSGHLISVDEAEHVEVAKCLHDLCTDNTKHKYLSDFAKSHVSDEVSTVGNALCWLYLADTLSRGENALRADDGGMGKGGKMKEEVVGAGEEEPEICWISDMARKKGDVGWAEQENRLPRANTLPPQ